MSDQAMKISLAPNGPLLVRGSVPLRVDDGPMDARESYALCRCGASGNKPFCDGSHARVGFSDAKAADRTPDAVKDYPGEQLTIHDNRGVCAHAGVCTDSLPEVWRYKQEPWIVADGGDAEAILEVVNACPSGALGATLKAGAAPVRAETAPGITVVPQGPYAVRGEVELEGATFGAGSNPGRYTLCRCGQSKNKPFCDGTHWNVEFDE